ncbi:MAG: ImmA/IrrE family metallo-endopeptidase [Solirubrobacteraceae bacterium]
MAGKDTNIGAKRARELREELGIDPEVPLRCVLDLVVEDIGVPVVVAALPEGVAGACWRAGEDTVLWVSGADAPVRRRFTLAHELGHLRCRHDGSIPVDTVQTLSGKTSDAREIQANAFAAELLVPGAGVREMVGGREPSLDDVVLIAERYGVSCFAALFRLNTLRLASDYEQLKDQVDAGEHEERWEALGCAPFDDTLGGLDAASLPWLAPALHGSALHLIATGRASTESVAAATGGDADGFASAAQKIGV